MKLTVSLVASPSTTITYRVGDRVLVELFDSEQQSIYRQGANQHPGPQPYRVIYVDPESGELGGREMSDAEQHLATLKKIMADHVAAHYRQVATLGRPAKGLQTSLRIDALAYAIRAIEERDELLKLIREVEAYGAPRFNRAISDLIARIEQCEK